MNCAKCKHEFCWICMGDYYRYRHNNGMEIYCAQSGFSKFLLVMLTVSMILLKVLSFFWDRWSVPQIFTLLTIRNVVYYGSCALLANFAFGVACFSANQYVYPRQTSSLRFGHVYIGLVLFFIPWSQMFNTGLQIMILELTALPTIIIMGFVSICTFVVGMALFIFFIIPGYILRILLSYWVCKFILAIACFYLICELQRKFNVLRVLKLFISQKIQPRRKVEQQN